MADRKHKKHVNHVQRLCVIDGKFTKHVDNGDVSKFTKHVDNGDVSA